VLTWHLGRRPERDTLAFTEKINEATQGQFQITIDRFKPNVDAVHHSLGTHIDFAQLVKVYAATRAMEAGITAHQWSSFEILGLDWLILWLSGSREPWWLPKCGILNGNFLNAWNWRD